MVKNSQGIYASQNQTRRGNWEKRSETPNNFNIGIRYNRQLHSTAALSVKEQSRIRK